MNIRKLFRILIFVLVMVAGVAVSVSAENSFLLRSSFGPRFSTQLQRTLDPSIYTPSAFDFTTDGKIVIVGRPEADAEITIQRLHPDATLDTTFGTGGIVTFFIEPGTRVNDVAVYDDGRILLVGEKYGSPEDNAYAMRLNADGTPDTTFFTTGTVWLGEHSTAKQVIILPSEKILIAGSASGLSTYAAATVFRLHVNGTFDNSFGSGGRAQVDIDPETQRDALFDFLVTPAGDIIASGIAQNLTDDWYKLFIMQLSSNGQADSAFGTDGVFTYEHDDFYANTIARRDDGKIIFSGYGYDENGSKGLLGRLNANGTLDNSFGTAGIIDLYDPSLSDAMPIDIEHILLYPDGRMMLDGVTGGQTTLTLTDANGVPDPAYNDDGVSATFGIGGTVDIVRLANGQFLRLTRSTSGGTQFGALQRIHPDGMFDTGGRMSVNHNEAVKRNETARAVAVSPSDFLYVAGTVNNGSSDQFVLHRYDGKGEGSAGYEPTPVSGFIPWDIAIDNSNRAVVVGKLDGSNGFHIRRYLSNGSLDLAVTDDLGGFATQAHALLIQPDNKMIVGGVKNGDFTVARFNEDGSLDKTFGTDGIAIHDFGNSYESVSDLAFGLGGKIVAQGSTLPVLTNYAAIVQFSADGTPDPTFTPYVSTLPAIPLGLAVQQDGKIVSTGTYNGRWTVWRLTANGTPDFSFGAGGYKTVFVGAAMGYDVMVQADGKIVTVGCLTGGLQDQTVVVRMDTHSVFDQSFSDDGKAKFLLGDDKECARAVVPTRDFWSDYEDFVVVGNAEAPNGDDMWAFLRLRGASNSLPAPTAVGLGAVSAASTASGQAENSLAMLHLSMMTLLLAIFTCHLYRRHVG